MFESGSKTCCLISGASRGFGRSVAVALAGQFSDSGTKGHFILISRSGDDLEETRNTIIQVCATAEGKASHIRNKGGIMRQFPIPRAQNGDLTPHPKGTYLTIKCPYPQDVQSKN